jgi:hypothetical protein
MRGTVYAEYIENGDHRIYVGVGSGKSMTLTWSNTGDVLTFRNRRALLRWLVDACPDEHLWAFLDGVTVCGGSIRELGKRCGVLPRKRKAVA